MNDETKIKAVLAICLFTISMVVVGMLCYKTGWQTGYEKGYADADQDWKDYLNAVWDDFVDYVYREGYAEGYNDGYLWGYVEAWLLYGADQVFQHPDGRPVP